MLSLDQVIRYELILVDTNQVLLEIGPSVSATNDLFVFTLQLKDDANFVASQVQMHFWTHNATYFKYGHNKTKCQFNFLRPIIHNSYIDNKKSIYLWRNNMWVNP